MTQHSAILSESQIPGRILFDLAQSLAASPEKVETALAQFGVVLNNSSITNKEKVKILEKEILKIGQTSVEAFETSDKLYHFGQLVLWNRQVRDRLIQPDLLLQLMKMAGIKGHEKPRVSMVSKRSANFCYFISTGSNSFFLRYHDPMGLSWLPRHRPIRSTAIYALAAQVFRNVLTEKEVVRVLWPSVHDSFRWLQDDRSDSIEDIEGLARRCVFQPDLRTTATRMDWLPQKGFSYKDTIGLYGEAVGRLHGRSMIFLSSSNGKIFYNNSELSTEFQRFPGPNRYAGYLEFAGWLPQLINRVSPKIKEKLDVIGCGKREPKAYWKQLCEASAQAFEETPVLGHMDLKMGNLYVEPHNNVIFADFDYITKIDPAFEVGQCLYSLVRRCLEDGVKVTENFIKYYFERYIWAYRRETGSLPMWLARSSGFGAMTILAISSSDYASPLFASDEATGPIIANLFERAGLA